MLPQRQSIRPGTFPVPVDGINAVSSLANMSDSEAVRMINIEPTTRGVKVRSGYEEFANVVAELERLVSIIPYTGTAENGSRDKIFVGGIRDYYDITGGGVGTIEPIPFPAAISGNAFSEVFTNDGGERVLLLVDTFQGLFVYTEDTDSWAQGNILNGPVDAAQDFAHIAIWKNRVWYTEKNSSNAWYTELGTYEGPVTKFNFGSKFRSGGYLVGLYSWTLDSGEGPDDYLVALSSAGDVVIYRGTNPADANAFGIVGSWYVGKFPPGRRVAAQYGGDLLLLSQYGVISATDLLRGLNPFTHEGSLSYKINPLLRPLLAAHSEFDAGWGIHVHPELAKIIIVGPTPVIPRQHFVYDINLKAWSIWQGIILWNTASFNGEVYFVSNDFSLQVFKITGNQDEGANIDWEFLTAYSDLGEPQVQKVVDFIRPNFTIPIGGFITYSVGAVYDYGEVPIGSENHEIREWVGGSGIGRTLAIKMSGSSNAETLLTDIGIMWHSGRGL